MTINVIMVVKFKVETFDPYPFILLNLVLSCISALQAPVIMMSQNRSAKKDSLRGKNDYKTDLKLVSTNNLIATKEQAESLHYKTDAVIGDMESVAVMQTLAKTKTPAAILRAVSDNPAAGVLPLDTNSGTFANKWIENTAEISKHFPAVLKILVS